MTERESHFVELVSSDGSPVGAMTVAEAHRAPGHLHRAFSVFLLDRANGRVLLQQRAAVKTRFPLRWANSCCGHPRPGEDVAVAAGRRLVEELGIADVVLTSVGVYSYRAEDLGSGRVEHEYDHVLVGEVPMGWHPTPDPAEVADTAWVTVPSLLNALAADPDRYAPWLAGVTACLAESSVPASSVPASSAPASSAAAPSSAAERSGGR